MILLKHSIAVLLAVSLLTACGSKDKKEETKKETETTTTSSNEDNTPASRLEGAWEIKRAEGTAAETNVGTVYTFKGNKLSFGKEGFNNPGNTQITDSTFSFQAEGNEYKFMYDYKFNGDTLVVAMQKSGGQVFHMTKQ
jgi:major membrane immunogen (membrane-anchored lipoprotein)